MRRASEQAGAGGGLASGSHRPAWIGCATLLAVTVALTWWPQGLETWRYDRDAIAAGEIWRLVTGHLVHVGAAHFALNLLGLALLAELLWNGLRAWHGAAVVIASMTVIDLALWYRYPGLDWYAGLSGVLHGLWAACALIGLQSAPAARSGRRNGAVATERFSPKLVSAVALLLLCAKIGVEYQAGAVSNAIGLAGVPAVYAAHWYGAMAGATCGMLLLCLTVWKQRAKAPEDFDANFD